MSLVLEHPRCQNCHPSDDRPRQGDDRHAHFMNVRRGPEDRGVVGMRCSTCHGESNQEDTRLPGAPHWRLAPRSMGWMGLSASEICRALLAREKNGGRSLAELTEHLTSDPLVAWGWDPGPMRTPVPLTREQWREAVDTWSRAGAPCPEAEAAP
jgi:hypothetical protein